MKNIAISLVAGIFGYIVALVLFFLMGYFPGNNLLILAIGVATGAAAYLYCSGIFSGSPDMESESAVMSKTKRFVISIGAGFVAYWIAGFLMAAAIDFNCQLPGGCFKYVSVLRLLSIVIGLGAGHLTYRWLIDRPGLFPKRTDDAAYLALAQMLSGRLAPLADALVRGAEAVSRDCVNGWETEAEIMANLEAFEEEFKEIDSLLKITGTPRSPQLKQFKQHIDSFLRYSKLAFHWGKLHYQDASGGAGERAKHETGMARTAAIRRVTNNAMQFSDNAFIAAQNAAQALAIIEFQTGSVVAKTDGDRRVPIHRPRRPRRSSRPRRPEV